MPRRNKIDLLPTAQRAAIEEFLELHGFGNYADAAAAIEKKFGVKLSRSALTRYGSKLESRLAILRVASEKARAIVQELGPGAGVELGQALIRAAQSHVFDALLEATKAQLGRPDLVSLGTLAATLEKTRLAEQRRADAAQDRLARAARIVEPSVGGEPGAVAAAAPGLSQEKTRELRAVLIGAASEP
jgi:hypothetical protein